MMPVRSGRRKRSTGKEDDLVTRSVVFALEYTTVFRGAPPVVGPAALLLGNIDNDPKGEVEVAVGGVDGRLVIFKGGSSSTSAPFLVASGDGSHPMPKTSATKEHLNECSPCGVSSRVHDGAETILLSRTLAPHVTPWAEPLFGSSRSRPLRCPTALASLHPCAQFRTLRQSKVKVSPHGATGLRSRGSLLQSNPQIKTSPALSSAIPQMKATSEGHALPTEEAPGGKRSLELVAVRRIRPILAARHTALNSCRALEHRLHLWHGSLKGIESYTGRTQPLWSMPCPRNVSACCIADINGDDRQEVVVGTLDGCVYVLSMEVNPEVVGTESHGRSRDRRNRRRRRDQSRGEKGTSGQASAAPDANSDVYSSSSTDRSRRSASPTMDGAVEDHTSRWLADDDESLTGGPEASGEVGVNIGPSADKGDILRGTAVAESAGTASTSAQGHALDPSQASAEEAASRARAWMDNATSAAAEQTVLSPHLKTLLKLQARGPITSVSTISFPCSGRDVRPLRPIFGSGANVRNRFEDNVIDSDDEVPLDEERYKTAPRCGGESGAGADSFQPGVASESGAGQGVSAAGVYVALGLRNETVQVMRLSHRQEETGDLELVDPTQPDTTDGAALGFGSGVGGCGDPGGSGGGSSNGEGDSPDSPEERLHGETLARERESWFDVDGSDGERDDLSRPLRLDGVVPGGAGDEGGFVSSRVERSWGHRGRGRRVGDDPQVPFEVHGDLPLSHNGWAGKGLVVPLASATTSASVFSSVSPSPTTTPIPRARVSRGNPTTLGGRSSVKEGVGIGAGSSRGCGALGGGVSSREDGGVKGEECGADGDEAQAFGLCSSDGRVCCCRLICSPGMQPRWRTVWARQTEEVMCAFGRLDYPNRSDRRGQSLSVEEGKETLLVACAISGITFLFDAEGGTCITFDPGDYLRQPVTAFAAGHVTTSPGMTEPALVYLSAGGHVTVFHGLFEQAGSLSPPQFLQTIRNAGALDTLEGLLAALRNRLERHPNQGDRLFPRPSPKRSGAGGGGNGYDCEAEEDVGAEMREPDLVHAGRSSSGLGGGLSGPQSASRREQAGGALCLPDELLARAVLCRAGALKALPETAKEGSGGASEKGTGCASGERWRREARAIARGEKSAATVAEGLSAVKRVLKELETFRARPRERTLRRYPRLRGTLEALSLVGLGTCGESLRTALKESMSRGEACPSPT